MPPPETDDTEPLRTFDWTDRDGPAAAVVTAVAEAAGADPADMEPLYGSVDPDALDAILSAPGPGRRPLDGSVAFGYLGYDVVLTGDGRGYLYDDVDVAAAATAAARADE